MRGCSARSTFSRNSDCVTAMFPFSSRVLPSLDVAST